jgi:hypothetical protein
MSVAAITTPTKQLHADNGQLGITISGTTTEFSMRSVDLTYEAASDETTSSADNGWFNAIPGVRKVSGSITFIYDLANKPASSPYALKVAASAGLQLAFNAHQAANLASGDATASEVWAGQALISNFKAKPGPAGNGPLECSFDFVSQGAWTGPLV